MKFRNLTPCAALAFDFHGHFDQPFHVVVLRATFTLGPDGRLRFARDQRPLVMADEHHGEPGASSPRRESDLCPLKPRADVVVTGHAWAPGGVASPSWLTSLRVGAMHKVARVTGARGWRRDGGGWHLEDPTPTVKVPLRYELAHGGPVDAPWDHRVQGNPLGVGARPHALGDDVRWIPAPQFESVDRPVTAPGAALDPVGFGPLGRSWHPRLALAGTYDDRWRDERWPSIPDDFDFGFYNGAPGDQQMAGMLDGNESVTLHGLWPDGPLETRLPGHHAFALLRFEDGEIVPMPMRLDTLEIDTDARTFDLV